jgi:hypothetical protein
MSDKSLLKVEVLEVIEDCINVFCRGSHGFDEFEYQEHRARLDAVRVLLEASTIHFKPIQTDFVSIH